MSLSYLELSLEQKEASIYAFYQIARSDNHLDMNEISWLQNMSENLGEVFDHLSISKLITTNSPKHIETLETFNTLQKEWFVIGCFSVINSDCNLFDEEFSLINGFFKVMGITREWAIQIVSKSNLQVNFY